MFSGKLSILDSVWQLNDYPIVSMVPIDNELVLCLVY